ncbi:nucleoside-diphosphate sugar epimerase [Lysinibacillus sp. LZ02]|uniref:nucleoside-diphosphate sugar epimerase n=1 Tax=Lysinibacillus sp. LZ02 TaxID=3420668 RepID=UPI003D368B34
MLRLSWLISIGISLLGVIVIEHFFTLKADDISTTSGNLGAVGITLVIPFIVLSLLTTFRYFTELSRHAHDRILRNCFIIGGIALLIAFIYFAIDYKNDIYTSLGGTEKESHSSIYGFPKLNEYTNKIYLNFYTFAAIHTLTAIIGGLYGIFKRIKQVENSEH